jgi:hypothetical protein
LSVNDVFGRQGIGKESSPFETFNKGVIGFEGNPICGRKICGVKGAVQGGGSGRVL